MNSWFPEIKKNFGFGCMRLPMKDEQIDEAAFCAMIDKFIADGFNYFDTARPYHGGMSEKALKTCLTTRHDREIGAGATLWGIHKDDIRVTLNGRPARLYASQGQQRSLALAMKLAEGEVSAKESEGDMPVFLFDDVLSELDGHRRDYLVRQLRGRQVIMTACDPAAADFGGDVRLIRVQDGGYTPEEV